MPVGGISVFESSRGMAFGMHRCQDHLNCSSYLSILFVVLLMVVLFYNLTSLLSYHGEYQSTSTPFSTTVVQPFENVIEVPMLYHPRNE
jgi:hypothetical protein